MQVYAPDVLSIHLAALDPSRGPFAAIDAAAFYGPLAALRAGELVGYTRWLRGLYPEKFSLVNGVPVAKNSSTEKTPRGPSRCHDPLPWLPGQAAPDDRLTKALLEASRATMRVDMPINSPNDIEWAHQGMEPGWPGRSGGGAFGHHAHVENALMCLLHDANDARSRAVWNAWLDRAKRYPPAKMFNRETHTHFVRCRLAALWTGDTFWRTQAESLARFLIQRQLAEHGEALYHPGWPYAVWQVLGREAEPWLVAAADWAGDVHAGLGLSAIAFWITDEGDYLKRHLPGLVRWANSYFRAPGRLDWHGLCTGRTGDGYAPNYWPMFKRALLDAGITDVPAYALVADNWYPMATGRFVDLRGGELREGVVRFRSNGGDTTGGRIRRVDLATGRYAGEINLEGPWGKYYGTAPYKFDVATPAAQVACWYSADHSEQVGAPVTADVGEFMPILPAVSYEVGTCLADLELDGPGDVLLAPVKEHVTFYDYMGRPELGLFTGQAESKRATPYKNVWQVDARGPEYSRWRFMTTVPGKWRVRRAA